MPIYMIGIYLPFDLNAIYFFTYLTQEVEVALDRSTELCLKLHIYIFIGIYPWCTQAGPFLFQSQDLNKFQRGYIPNTKFLALVI